MAQRKQARRSAKKKSKVAAKKLGRASPRKPRTKPLSLYPLSFEEAMRRIIAVSAVRARH